MPTILINLPPHGVTPEAIAQIREIMPGYDVRVTQDRDEMESLLGEMEIAAGWPLGALIVRAPKLRWYQQWMAGSDWLSRHPEAIEQDFLLTNASGVHGVQIGEHILAFMLAFVRRLPAAVRQQAAHEWKAFPGEGLGELYERTLLMVGLGPIGRRTAQVAAALGMHVIGVRRSGGEPPPGVDALYTPDRLHWVLPQADFVALAVPLTSATRGLIGERELRLMKPSAFLVNVGRGRLIDEEALVRSLREGWIAGAGLDVFETEPLPPESPLWDLPNAILTSHYAGASPRYYERAMPIFLDNLRRYRDGTQLRNLVDKRAAS